MRFNARDAARRFIGRLGMQLGQRGTLTRVGGCLLVVVVLAIGVTIWDLRRVALADALASTDTLAIVLAEQTNLSVQAVDIVLRDVQERIAALGVSTPAEFRTVLRTPEVHAFLRTRVDRLPQVNDITLIDADGNRLNNSLDWPVMVGNLSDREYARHFAAEDDPGLFISQPTINRATHVWSLYLVRRMNGPHGDYLGMVIAAIPLRAFVGLYQSISLPRNESLLLLRRDGIVLARHPDPIDRSGAKMPASSGWYAQVAQGGGHYESPGYFDGLTRLVAVRLLRDFPLVMDVTVSKDTALAHWRREATLIALGTVCAAGCLLLLLRALERQLRRLQDQRAALQASEARLAATSGELETTLASMDQGLVMVDAAGAVAVCNRRAIELLDLPAALMAGRPSIDAVASLRLLTDGLGRHGAPTEGNAAIEVDRTPSQIYERTLPNGQIVEVRKALLASGAGWMATFDDVTARRRAEQQVVFMEGESRAKSGFLAMMSHEIRTPMNGVLGLAGALFDTELTEEQRKTVAAIQDSGSSLMRILNDILDFSKLDAGQMQLEDQAFSILTLTEDPISLLGPKAAAKGLRINALCDDGLPDALLGDAGRLRQVLLNLVSNAIKFTRRGSVVIRAACAARDDRIATIVWTVTDTGIGIPPDRIGGLFGEFFQADASITRRFGGSGLGLAICKRLIEQMGGTIAVTSQPGEGSTFAVTLRLPITQPVHAATAQIDAVGMFKARLSGLDHPGRILFAEDNPTNQLVAQQLLRGFDVQVDVVADGLEAVHAAAEFVYDVICMDMRMPEMDGLAATRAIRAMGGRLAIVPIIALTANAFPEDVAACVDAGMTGFLAKPVSKQSLLAALLSAFGQAPGAIVIPTTGVIPTAGADRTDEALDRQRFAGLKEAMGEDDVAGLVALFEVETAARLVRIADRRLDRETLTREIHSLKGAAGTACAVCLAGRAAELEMRLRRGEDVTDADLPALTQAFEAWRDKVHEAASHEAAIA
jgi:signal transduction histidine kinase/CheY-like chemotaxis protein/HPt (histidine-containing phosphotransfer) domain-containing protein